jgi:hypothetical protein
MSPRDYDYARMCGRCQGPLRETHCYNRDYARELRDPCRIFKPGGRRFASRRKSRAMDRLGRIRERPRMSLARQCSSMLLTISIGYLQHAAARMGRVAGTGERGGAAGGRF